MRYRRIKHDFWSDGKILALSDAAALFFIGLWNQADDEGRLLFDISEIEAKNPRFIGKGMELLEPLIKKDLVLKYGSGPQYLQIKNFKVHQYIDRPTPSKFPAPPPLKAEKQKKKPTQRRPKA